jgi:hypothetical protein
MTHTATASRRHNRDWRGDRRGLYVRVPLDVHDRITAEAKAAGLSLSDYVISRAGLVDPHKSGGRP